MKGCCPSVFTPRPSPQGPRKTHCQAFVFLPTCGQEVDFTCPFTQSARRSFVFDPKREEFCFVLFLKSTLWPLSDEECGQLMAGGRGYPVTNSFTWSNTEPTAEGLSRSTTCPSYLHPSGPTQYPTWVNVDSFLCDYNENIL